MPRAIATCLTLRSTTRRILAALRALAYRFEEQRPEAAQPLHGMAGCMLDGYDRMLAEVVRVFGGKRIAEIVEREAPPLAVLTLFAMHATSPHQLN